MEFDFSKRMTAKRKEEFARIITNLQDRLLGSDKISSRGWAYLLEGERYINKTQFDKIQDAINECRKCGLLPVDLVQEEAGRLFSGVEEPDTMTLEQLLNDRLLWALEGYDAFTPDWWEDEEYYIQVVVEKVDLVTFFKPVCRRFHIPIANSKGWSSILQRAEYARRFKQAEDRGLKCVLLYCGDHDPDGLRISDTIRDNLYELRNIVWNDSEEGYDPTNLTIDRFGLSYAFIQQHGLTWIDNLLTGNKKGIDLSHTSHPNHKLPYVQQYLKLYGARKCEANAIVTRKGAAQRLILEAILKYLGKDADKRFKEKEKEPKRRYLQALTESGLEQSIRTHLGLPERDEEEDDEDQDDDVDIDDIDEDDDA